MSTAAAKSPTNAVLCQAAARTLRDVRAIPMRLAAYVAALEPCLDHPDNADDLAGVAAIVERACDRLLGQVEDAAHELGLACRALDRWHGGGKP